MRDHDAYEYGRPTRLCARGSVEADEVGQVAQTRHQELTATDDRAAASMWDVARVAARAATPRLERLRFVTITSDALGSFAAWVESLRAGLDDAGWRPGRGPDIEVLRVANDADPSIDAAHQRVSAEGITIRTVSTGPNGRPLPLALARPFAFRCVRELGWVPSARSPVWSLDEDFRFDTLVPSPGAMFVRRSGGPLFHRLDALIARLAGQGVDVLIGGNSGAAPVPALGLMLGQLQDLAYSPANRTTCAAALRTFAQLRDGYYDLAEANPCELRLPLTRAWWRTEGQIELDEVARRLKAGLPVTRPALAMPLGATPSAWAVHDHAGPAGGNTVLLSPRALEADFVHVRHGPFTSRRADTTWAINARALGARVVRACLPLFHDRQRCAQTPAQAAREAVFDALGVGVYQALLANDKCMATVLARAEARLAALNARLVAAEKTARSVGAESGTLQSLADWMCEARARLTLAYGPTLPRENHAQSWADSSGIAVVDEASCASPLLPCPSSRESHDLGIESRRSRSGPPEDANR